MIEARGWAGVLCVMFIAAVTGAVILGCVWAAFAVHASDEEHKFNLRKAYVEKCKMTPTQAEKLVPENSTP